MSYRTGANVQHQNEIARYFEAGYDAEYISKRMRIVKSVVEKFAPVKAKEAVKKTKARNKKAQAEHTKIMDAKKSPDIMPDAPKPESE